jgi:hypothetical protein
MWRVAHHVCSSALSSAPGPLEAFAVQFDPLFHTLAQRHGFRTYLAGLLLPRDRSKTVRRSKNAPSSGHCPGQGTRAGRRLNGRVRRVADVVRAEGPCHGLATSTTSLSHQPAAFWWRSSARPRFCAKRNVDGALVVAHWSNSAKRLSIFGKARRRTRTSPGRREFIAPPVARRHCRVQHVANQRAAQQALVNHYYWAYQRPYASCR